MLIKVAKETGCSKFAITRCLPGENWQYSFPLAGEMGVLLRLRKPFVSSVCERTSPCEGSVTNFNVVLVQFSFKHEVRL